MMIEVESNHNVQNRKRRFFLLNLDKDFVAEKLNIDILEKPWHFEAKKVKTYFSEEL